MEKLYKNLERKRKGVKRIPTRETNRRSFIKEFALRIKLFIIIAVRIRGLRYIEMRERANDCVDLYQLCPAIKAVMAFFFPPWHHYFSWAADNSSPEQAAVLRPEGPFASRPAR